MYARISRTYRLNLHFHIIRRALFRRFTKIFYGMTKRFMRFVLLRHAHVLLMKMVQLPYIIKVLMMVTISYLARRRRRIVLHSLMMTTIGPII